MLAVTVHVPAHPVAVTVVQVLVGAVRVRVARMATCNQTRIIQSCPDNVYNKTQWHVSSFYFRGTPKPTIIYMHICFICKYINRCKAQI